MCREENDYRPLGKTRLRKTEAQSAGAGENTTWLPAARTQAKETCGPNRGSVAAKYPRHRAGRGSQKLAFKSEFFRTRLLSHYQLSGRPIRRTKSFHRGSGRRLSNIGIVNSMRRNTRCRYASSNCSNAKVRSPTPI